MLRKEFREETKEGKKERNPRKNIMAEAKGTFGYMTRQ